jgi:aspartate/methionine/tyrosine aminotransferase
MKLSNRSDVAPFLAMEIARDAMFRAAAGQDVALLCVGQPWGGAPQVALKAAEVAMRKEGLGYTMAQGIPALRRAIAARYERIDGAAVDPERIIVTTGSSSAFSLAFIAMFDQGARVALGAPGYPPYRHILRALGCEVVTVPTAAENGFQITGHDLAAAHAHAPLQGAIVASPANPTGAISSAEDLGALLDHARQHESGLVVDEIYHGLTYEGDVRSVLALPGALDHPGLVVINSFSKYYAMPGWRIGWMVVPPAFVPVIDKLQQNMFICPPGISQVAAMAAISPEAEPELEGRKDTLRHNRGLLLSALPSLGIRPAASADGAFYIYADVSGLTGDSFEWCRRALDETNVAMTSGIDFDEKDGRHYIRIAYARETAEIERGLERLAKWRGRVD